jgi:hypothetical protein
MITFQGQPLINYKYRKNSTKYSKLDKNEFRYFSIFLNKKRIIKIIKTNQERSIEVFTSNFLNVFNLVI